MSTSIKYVPRQAIIVTYRGPTNARCARLVAKCEAHPRGVTTSWDYAFSREENYEAAACALIERMGWDSIGGAWVGGGTEDGAVFVWVE